MSDYLWDKTGEPDAEAERLEELLGQLRFQPTPFDLPAGLPAKDFRSARTRRSVLSWPRLALAASLTLAVLAGAWLMFKQQTGATNDAPQFARQNDQANAGAGNAAGAVGNTGAPAAEQPQGGETPRGERAAGGPRPPRVPDLDTPRRAVAPRPNRGESAGAPKRQKNLAPPPRVEPAPREERAAAEREAAEKVLYALRVTSEKLNYARQQVQETARGEDNR